jgi:hypothetical protein
MKSPFFCWGPATLLLDRNLHPLLATVAEAVVRLVHRAEVLERDVVAVVEALDDRDEIVRQVRTSGARHQHFLA